MPKDVVEGFDMLSEVLDVDIADKKSGEHTVVRLVFCQTPQQLSARLADETPQNEAEDD